MGGKAKAFILSRPALAFAWIVSGIAAIGLLSVWLFTGSIGNDFGVYWRTANMHPMWAYWHGFKYPFPYLPTMLLWIAPLKLLPLWPAYFLFVAASIFALIRAVQPYLAKPEIMLLIACPPAANGLMTGQVSALMAALMIWACATEKRVAAGIAFAVIASIKPQLAVLVPLLLLLRRDWTAIAAAAAGFLLLAAIATMTYGPDIWQTWFGSLPEFRYRLRIMGIGGFSPAATADSWGLNPLPFLLLGSVAGVWLIFRCRQCDAIATVAALGIASCLAAPYSLAYDFVVVAPFLVRAIFRNHLTAAVALSTAVPPLPLVLAGIELIRKKAGDAGALDREAGGVSSRHAQPRAAI